MAIELWRPMREMRRLAEEMERMMGETLGPLELRGLETLQGIRLRAFPVNMYLKDNDIIVEASLPGIRPEDVDVSATGRTLTIRAERKEVRERKETKEENYYYREMIAGESFRQITLPAEIQADKAEATFEDGILRLRLPLAHPAKEAHIKVKTTEAKTTGTKVPEAKATGTKTTGAKTTGTKKAGAK